MIERCSKDKYLRVKCGNGWSKKVKMIQCEGELGQRPDSKKDVRLDF